MPDTLLLIEDDLPLAALTAEFLRSENFEVAIAHRGDVAVKMIDAVRPDLLVMDVMLPGMDGFSLCREIRSSYSGRILMMTALDEDVEQLMGFHVGADDFVVKPIEPLLLVARIRALLRRDVRRPRPGQVFDHTFGRFRLDLRARRAWLDDKAVAFSAAEFDLLAIFARHAGTPLNRDQLLQNLRGVEYDGLNRSIDMRVSRLRKKLANLHCPVSIRTITTQGYLFAEISGEE